MGFRFQRRIRILPGLRLNLSKSGISASVGTRGAWFTIGPRGTRTTVGIPGTGLSYTEQRAPHNLVRAFRKPIAPMELQQPLLERPLPIIDESAVTEPTVLPSIDLEITEENWAVWVIVGAIVVSVVIGVIAIVI